MFFFHSAPSCMFAFFSSISMHYFVRLPLSCHEYFSHLLSFTIYSFFYYLFFHFLYVNSSYAYVSRVITLQVRQSRNRGLLPGRVNNYLSSPKLPDRLWGPPTHSNLIRAGFQYRAPIAGRQQNSYKPNAAICPQEPRGGWQLRSDTNRMQRAGVETNRKACYKKLLP